MQRLYRVSMLTFLTFQFWLFIPVRRLGNIKSIYLCTFIWLV